MLLRRSRKQQPMPLFSSNLFLASLPKEVEMFFTRIGFVLTQDELRNPGIGWTTLHSNWKGAVSVNTWLRTEPSVPLWQNHHSLYRSQGLVLHLKETIRICTNASTATSPPLTEYDAEIRYLRERCASPTSLSLNQGPSKPKSYRYTEMRIKEE